MKLKFILLLFSLLSINTYAQIDGNSIIAIPSVTNSTQMGTITSPTEGSIVYNLDDKKLYLFNGTSWIPTTNAIANEIALVSPIDVNNLTTDPGAVNETNVQEVVEAITPITSKGARVFYPPSIAINASTTGNNRTIDLYQEYINQFTATNTGSSAKSTGAPDDIPTYGRTDLYYYVTFYDNTIFSDISINANGVMTYDVDVVPSNFNTLINVVFVIK